MSTQNGAPVDAVINALKSVTGLSEKVYHAEALKNASAPFVFWIQSDESWKQCLDGYTGLKTDGYEIHFVTKNLDDLNRITSEAAEKLINLQRSEYGGFIYERVDIRQASPTIREAEVGLYRKVFEITIDYQETNN